MERWARWVGMISVTAVAILVVTAAGTGVVALIVYWLSLWM